MTELLELLRSPWPWYVGGPLIGLTVPLLLWLGNKGFGISANLRHACAILLPDAAKPAFFRYDWRKEGVLRTRSYKVEIVDRLGAGDSFAAGLIHGLLDNDPQKGLDWGVAMSAIKHSIPGDFAWVTAAEVESTVKGGGLRISR